MATYGTAAPVGQAVSRLAAVKVDGAIDDGFLYPGVTRKRMLIPDGDVGILTNVERTHPIIDPHDPRGIQGDHLERLVFRGAAVADGLGGLLIEPAGEIIRVTLDGHDHAFAHGHDRVPGNRVPC